MSNFICNQENCEVIATYGYNSGESVCCKEHATKKMKVTFNHDQFKLLENYKIKSNRICYYNDCNTQACFGFPEQKHQICCKKHSLSGMINLRSPICAFKNCTIYPTFNKPSEKKGLYCKEHAKTNMVDVINKKCSFKDCTSIPKFNYIGETKAVRCPKHAEENMVNVKDILCPCGKRPSFNIDGLLPRFCKDCKTENMVNVISNVCKCGATLRYNYPGLKAAFCNNCKQPDMVNVKDKLCCCSKSQPYFNFAGLKPEYCAECKLENMVNVRDKLCFCGKAQPYFNFTGLKPEFCAECKSPDMVNVKSKLCACKKMPHYNFSGLPAMYCSTCKEPGMVDVVSKTCKNSWCNILTKPFRNNGYCLRCFIHEFPDHKNVHNYKIKEKHVTDYLKQEFKDYDIVFDKKINGGCSKRRPDAYLDLLTHIIIIECDENQHKDYDTTCEIVRINELFTDLGDRPIVFIRFNPDEYDNIPSSFKYHKISGVPMVSNESEWIERLTTLKKCIIKHTKNVPVDTIFEYLFFDKK